MARVRAVDTVEIHQTYLYVTRAYAYCRENISYNYYSTRGEGGSIRRLSFSLNGNFGVY